MRKLKVQLIALVFALAVGLMVAAYWYTAPNRESIASVAENKVFSNKHLIAIRKDSLVNFVKNKYTTDVQIEDKKKFTIKLSGQGTRLSTFYNNNGNLLKVKDEGFSIIANTYEGSLEAVFSKEKKDNIEYIALPTDVLAGIVQQ